MCIVHTWQQFGFRTWHDNISFESTLYHQCRYGCIVIAKQIEQVEQITIGYCIARYNQQIVFQPEIVEVLA